MSEDARRTPYVILARMLEAVGYGLLIAFPLVGALVRRWFVVVLPLAGWPLF